MSKSKVYAVVLFDQAADELGSLVSIWLKRSELGCYINAKKVDPNGPYFHLSLENKLADGNVVDMELQLPHNFIKAVVYSSDIKSIGFV